MFARVPSAAILRGSQRDNVTSAGRSAVLYDGGRGPQPDHMTSLHIPLSRHSLGCHA